MMIGFLLEYLAIISQSLARQNGTVMTRTVRHDLLHITRGVKDEIIASD